MLANSLANLLKEEALLEEEQEGQNSPKYALDHRVRFQRKGKGRINSRKISHGQLIRKGMSETLTRKRKREEGKAFFKDAFQEKDGSKFSDRGNSTSEVILVL